MKYLKIFLIGILFTTPWIVIADDTVKYPAPVLEVIQITSNYPEVELLVREEFKNEPEMIRIARAESGFNEKAKNPTSSAFSVFQILTGTWKDYGCQGERGVAENEIKCARLIYNKSGLSPWNASKSVWSKL